VSGDTHPEPTVVRWLAIPLRTSSLPLSWSRSRPSFLRPRAGLALAAPADNGRVQAHKRRPGFPWPSSRGGDPASVHRAPPTTTSCAGASHAHPPRGDGPRGPRRSFMAQYGPCESEEAWADCLRPSGSRPGAGERDPGLERGRAFACPGPTDRLSSFFFPCGLRPGWRNPARAERRPVANGFPKGPNKRGHGKIP